VSVEGLSEVGGLRADEEVVLAQDLLLRQLLIAVRVGFEDLFRKKKTDNFIILNVKMA
jgi:hypothetical protein